MEDIEKNGQMKDGLDMISKSSGFIIVIIVL